MADKTLTRVQGGSTDTIHINTDKFAGVRTMTKSDPALSKNSTRMQLTYNPSGGDTDGLSGIYVRATSGDGESNAQVTWNQEGGNGKLFADEIRPVGSGDYVSWIFKDTSDDDPDESIFGTAAAHTLPWQDVEPFSDMDISFAPVTETLTVDRTASVIDSDRAGESRPILSKVVGGAAAAYSLRDLNEKGGHNLVVDVRNDSNVTEKFKAIDLVNGNLLAHCGSGNGFVEKWYDQSGNENHVVQTTTGKQPKIVSSGSLLTQGGKPCINFDGSDDCLNKATYTQGALSQPNTAFAVAKLDTYTDSNRKIFDGDASTDRNMLQLSTTGNGQFAHFAGTVVATGEDADADRHLFTCLFNGAASRLRIDTTQKSTANAGTNTMNGIVIGANHNTAFNFWDGDIQEIIIFNSSQTTNIPAIEANINNQYSIYS